MAELRSSLPKATRRMGANPHANGGLLLRRLAMPDFRDYAVTLPKPGTESAEATRVLGNIAARCDEAEPEASTISASSGRMKLLRTGWMLCMKSRTRFGWSNSRH